MYHGVPYSEVIEEMRQVFMMGKTRSKAWRISQLNATIKLMTENKDRLVQALYQDLGKVRRTSSQSTTVARGHDLFYWP